MTVPTPAAPTTSNRNRTIALVVAALVVIATVAGAFALGRSSSDTPSPNASTTTPTPPATSTQASLAVNGCLGGPDPTLAIGSVFSAPLTPAGAVEFTATLLRWIGDSKKTSDQLNTIGPKLIAPDLMRSISASSSGPETTVSTRDSVYSVTNVSKNSAVVNLIVTTTSGEQTLEGGGPYTLGVRDGHWYVTKVLTPGRAGDERSVRTLENIRATGTPLPGGCG